MTKREILDREQFATKLGEIAGLEGRRAAELLMRHAKTYQRVQEAVCNGIEGYHYLYNTPETINKLQTEHEAWCKKREQQLERRITQLCEIVGSKPVFSGDPRGCCVKLALASGETNDWGHEGYCVPVTE